MKENAVGLSRFFVAVAAVTCAAAPWMLGSTSVTAQRYLLGGAALTFLAGALLRFSSPPSRRALGVNRAEILCAGLGLLFLALLAIQALNPSHKIVFNGFTWTFQPMAPTPWAPQSLLAPFDGMPGDFLPYQNAWRYLLIFASAWMYAIGLALGFVQRTVVYQWAKLLGVNGAVLAVVCLVHRATGQPLTLWRYADTFDFTGSPVFFYKNHNGAYLAAMLSLVLGLAARAGATRARLAWEIVAFLLAVATAAVNSRVAFACACAWVLLYGVWKWRHRAPEAAVFTFGRLILGVAAALLLCAAVLTTGGGKVIARFAGASAAPAAFAGGGGFRGFTRDLAIEMWKDRPLWGWGGGAFVYLFETHHPRVPALAEHAYREQPTLNRLFGPTANCDWLEFLVEYGAIGGLLMAATAVVRAGQWVREKGWATGFSLFLAAGSVGLVVHAFYDYILRNPALLFLYLGLQIAALRSATEGKSDRRARRPK